MRRRCHPACRRDSAGQRVRRRSIHAAIALALVVVGGVRGGAWGQAPVGPASAELCRIQADAVEHAMGLPPGLLLAVGRVESGRTDPASRDVLPWPWTVDDEGQDHVFGSAFDAIAYVVAARGRGSRSLDVGCFQVNLQFHPDAFATVAEAFDPAANARYAGHLLSDLHTRTGSWETAVQDYHSATPWRGEAYRDLVLSRWAETSLAPAAAPAAAIPLPLPVPPALATRLSPSGGGFGQPAQGGGRSIMRVQYPSAPGAAPPRPRGRLPRVIVPSADAGLHGGH